MNRTVWLFRLLAALILLIAFALLAHLHSRLSSMQRPSATPAATHSR